MRKRYNEALDELHQELIKMANLCIESIEIATTLLHEEDDERLRQVDQLEKQIDKQERIIENQCMRLILLEQPVASDLRQVSTALKMIADMERIGDQALDIASLPIFPHFTLHTHLDDMCAMCGLMLNSVIKAFVQNDLHLASEVVKMDDIVDGLFLQVKAEAVKIIQEQPDHASDVLNLLMAAKYFERISDHSVNIAQCIY